MGHKASDCRLPKKNKNEANIVDEITREVSDIDLCAVISEVNLVGSNPKEPVPLGTYALTKVCSLPSNRLRAGRSYLWETLPYLLSKAKARWSLR